jgi:hypothetical protein
VTPTHPEPAWKAVCGHSRVSWRSWRSTPPVSDPAPPDRRGPTWLFRSRCSRVYLCLVRFGRFRLGLPIKSGAHWRGRCLISHAHLAQAVSRSVAQFLKSCLWRLIRLQAAQEHHSGLVESHFEIAYEFSLWSQVIHGVLMQVLLPSGQFKSYRLSNIAEFQV